MEKTKQNKKKKKKKKGTLSVHFEFDRDRIKSKKRLKDLSVTPTVSEPCIIFIYHFLRFSSVAIELKADGTRTLSRRKSE